MKENMFNGTCGLGNSKPFTIEDLRKMALTTYKQPTLMDLPEKKRSVIEWIMNKFGWYRQYEVIV